MKKLGTILKFELDNYFKSKSYIISTIIICILAVGIMFLPRITDNFKSDSSKESSSEQSDSDEDKIKMMIYDPNGIMDYDILADYYTGTEFLQANSVEELKGEVENEKVEAGFVINSLSDYDYYIFNKSMGSDDTTRFSEVMLMLVKMDYCTSHNLDIEEYVATEYTQISFNENVLGKDSTQNYWYCYILVILVFMIIIMYGTQIASSVTNEKSNRSIEILVTTTSSTAILFGKVFAGAIATVFQVGLVGLSLLGSYQYNKSYWGNGLEMFLDIPTEVIITFAVFGIGGFLIYAFMYGALGALVSKIEDLNKSAGTAQMLVMIVYFAVLFQLQNVDGIVMKVCSFLPISSYSAMFARVAMGNVATWEIVVSAVILYASVILVGYIGGRVFRSSTLRYGNPIKLSHALKGIKKDK